MLDDPSATEIQTILPHDMDLRSQENYLMLLYTVSKLLEVLDLKNTYFPQFGPWLEDVVLPVYKNLFQDDNSCNIVTLNASTPKEEQYTIIVELLEKVAKEPKEASSFFLPDMVPQGCHCGACIAFNVPQACQYVGKPGAGTQARIRKWVRESDRGCTGRNLNVMVGGKTK